MGFAPDSKKIITGSRDKTAKIWDMVGKESIVAFPEANAVYAVAVSPDGQNGIDACEDGSVRSWAAKPQTKTGKVLGSHGKPALRWPSGPIRRIPKRPRCWPAAARTAP